MKTAVDTSVLLDILLADREFAERSKLALQSAREKGALVVSDTVIAELGPALERDQINLFLEDLTIQFLPSNLASALLAAEMMGHFRRRGGRAGRVVPDFMIGAHAMIMADCLLARDRGYFRDYYKDLKIISP